MSDIQSENQYANIDRGKILVVRPLPLMISFFLAGLTSCFYLFRYAVFVYAGLILFAFVLLFFNLISKKMFVLVLLAILLSLSGMLYRLFYASQALEEGFYSGIGVVSSIDSQGNAILESVNLEGIELKGKISVSGLSANVGDSIAFAGNLTNLRLDDKFELHQIAKGVYYKMDLSFAKYNNATSYSFRNGIITAIYDGFLRCSNENVADYLVSLMFGRSEMLDKTIRQDFTAIGVAHVFAVSGLHVGVLVSVLVFILRKLKLDRNITLITVSAILFFYTYLCSFSPSVIRASLMSVLSMAIFRIRHKADKISVLSFTALASLLIKPVWIGDMSFLLSYGAYTGILFLLPFLRRAFSRIGHFRPFTEMLALNTAVSLTLIPLTMFFFNSYSIFALIASFAVIPLTSAVFVVAFASIPFLALKTLALPFGYVLNLLVTITGGITARFNLAQANVSFSISELGIFLWLSAIVVISDFVNLNWKKKSIIAITLCGLAFLV